MNSTYFGLLAEFGEAHIPLEKVAPKYFGLSGEEAKRRAPAKLLPCTTFRLGGQKSPWLVSRERSCHSNRRAAGPAKLIANPLCGTHGGACRGEFTNVFGP